MNSIEVAYQLTHNGGFCNGPAIAPTSNRCPEDKLNPLNGIGATHPIAEPANEAELAIFDDIAHRSSCRSETRS